jgi:hypothetical protein
MLDLEELREHLLVRIALEPVGDERHVDAAEHIHELTFGTEFLTELARDRRIHESSEPRLAVAFFVDGSEHLLGTVAGGDECRADRSGRRADEACMRVTGAVENLECADEDGSLRSPTFEYEIECWH